VFSRLTAYCATLPSSSPSSLSLSCLQARNWFWLCNECCLGSQPCQCGIGRWTLRRMSVSITIDCCDAYSELWLHIDQALDQPVLSGRRNQSRILIKLWRTLSTCKLSLFRSIFSVEKEQTCRQGQILMHVLRRQTLTVSSSAFEITMNRSVDRGKLSCTYREGRSLLSQARPADSLRITINLSFTVSPVFVIMVNSSFTVYDIFRFVTIWCTVAMKMIISLYVQRLLGVGS
jgi:hypothetical protein